MSDDLIVKPDPSLPHAEQPGLVLAALTLYGEARGEKALGKKAVLWCIKNRRRMAREFVAKRGRAHPLFGDGSLASCVLKKYQFSCWLANDPNLHVLSQAVETEGESFGPGAWGDMRTNRNRDREEFKAFRDDVHERMERMERKQDNHD